APAGLRIGRAPSADRREADWGKATVVASGPGSCGGLCGMTTACIADAMKVESCVAPTSDCTAMCGSSDVCYQGACVKQIAAATVEDTPGGTGLYVSLVVLPD